MREKLLRLMKSEGLTSSKLAEILGTGASNISHIISGRSKPGYELLRKILLCFPRINPDWLLLDDEIEIPEPPDEPGSGGGFEPGVDDWDDIETDIII